MFVSDKTRNKLRECAGKIEGFFAEKPWELIEPIKTEFGENNSYTIKVAEGADGKMVTIWRNDRAAFGVLAEMLLSEAAGNAEQNIEMLLDLIIEWSSVKARLTEQAEEAERVCMLLDKFEV